MDNSTQPSPASGEPGLYLDTPGDVTIFAFSLTLPNGVILGAVPGYSDGAAFADRRELHDRSIHKGLVQGIAVSGSSVALNGGYEDEDFGDVIFYTGEGGRNVNTGRQVADQELTKGNLALARNSDAGIPVRVVRGSDHRSVYAPKRGYRYDGLFRIDSYWRAVGRDGFKIWRFRLERLATEADAAKPEIPSNLAPERRDVVISRIIRNTSVGEEVKSKYSDTCQICGKCVRTKSGTYSECCHIRPLGKPHNGSDMLENVLCLCPNCHVSFDRGALTVSDDLIVSGRGTPLKVSLGHAISKAHLSYHRGLFE